MISSIEVDMNNNYGIFYCSPDFLISIKDFYDSIKIGVQTKGHENVTKGENILLNIGFLGRCSIIARTKYKLNIKDVVQVISSK